MKIEYPLISCICVSYNRPHYLKKAIKYFQAQDYPNKELVIVYRSTDPETKQLVDSSTDGSIRGMEYDYSEEITLGDIRNQAIAFTNGDIFCNWDDDDWYHPLRLSTQYGNMRDSGQSAALVTNMLVYDELMEQAYFSMFRLWETSILCEKSNITDTVKYGSLNRSEDAVLVNKLMELGSISPCTVPNLIIYRIHGSNTMQRSHYQKLFKLSQPLSKSTSNKIQGILEGIFTIDEAKEILADAGFLQELNFFYKKAGYIMLTGLTTYRTNTA